MDINRGRVDSFVRSAGMDNFYQQKIHDFQPRHDFLIAVDSDGTVLDSVRSKMMGAFLQNFISVWNLQDIESLVEETVEYVTLKSSNRGGSRWMCMSVVLELLQFRITPARRLSVPDGKKIRAFAESGLVGKTDNAKIFYRNHPSDEMKKAIHLSESMDLFEEEFTKNMQPFPLAPETLKMIREKADLVVISMTPMQALDAEWRSAGIYDLPALICGSDFGNKKDVLSIFHEKGYALDHMLMIGDALIDLNAAREVGAYFYPILQDMETESWKTFRNKIFTSFLLGEYQATDNEILIDRFESSLTGKPHWSINQ